MDNSTTNLNIVKTEVEPCHVRLDIEVSEAQTKKVFEDTVRIFSRTVRIPGFRPGKAPRKLLMGRYRGDIDNETKRELFRTTLRAALEQESITPETNPRIENEDAVTYTDGQPFVYAITFDVPPEFALPEYKGIQVSKDAAAVDEGSVQEVIDNFLQQRASYDRVERASEEGDLLKVSYKGTIQDAEEEPPETAKFLLEAQETWLALREPELIPGVSKELCKLEAGAEKDVELTFPEDFGIEALAGKKVAYHFTLHEVHAAQVPEFDDKIAKEIGAESADEIRERVRQNLESEKERRENQSVRDQIVQALTGGLDFPLPPNMLRRETYQILSRLYDNEMRSGTSPDEIRERSKELSERADNMAKQQLKQHYILEKIADAEDIKVEANELDAAIETLSNMHRVTTKVMARRLRDSGRLADVLIGIRESKTLDHLVSLAEITENESVEK